MLSARGAKTHHRFPPPSHREALMLRSDPRRRRARRLDRSKPGRTDKHSKSLFTRRRTLLLRQEMEGEAKCQEGNN